LRQGVEILPLTLLEAVNTYPLVAGHPRDKQ
jgi:hypothetical protein